MSQEQQSASQLYMLKNKQITPSPSFRYQAESLNVIIVVVVDSVTDSYWASGESLAA